MTTLHDLCHHESHRWQPLIRQHLITTQLDRYVLPELIQSVLAYLTPHPCSNQIKRFGYGRLRITHARGGSSFDKYLQWKAYKDHGSYVHVEVTALIDALWFHHQHLDEDETLDSCDVCQRGDKYMYFTANTNYHVNSHICPYIPIHLNIEHGISRILSNPVGYTSNRRALLYKLATIEVKRVLTEKKLYHPEGVVSVPMLHELEERYTIHIM